MGLRRAALALFLVAALLLSGCGVLETRAPTRTPFLSPTPTVTGLPTASPSPTVTRTPTALPTATPQPTPTLPPAAVGTAIPGERQPIIEANLNQIREVSRWGRGRVEALAWSPDGALIAVSTPLGVYLYNAGTLTVESFLDTRAAASRLLFSQDGSRLAVATTQVSAEGITAAFGVQVWDVGSAQLSRSLVISGQVLAMAFPAGETGSLAVISRFERGQQFGARVGFWDLGAGGQTGTETRFVELIGGEVAVDAALSPDLRFAAYRGQNGPVRIWLLENGANLATTPESGEAAGPLAFSPDSLTLAVGYPDAALNFLNENYVRVWRVPQSGRPEVPSLALFLRDATRAEGAEQAIVSLAWSPDGSRIAAGYEDRTVHVWRAQAGDAYRRMTGETLPLGLAWSPDGARIAAGGLEVFTLSDAARIGFTDDFIPDLYDMDFTPDGSSLALAEYSQIEFRDTETGLRRLVITGMDGTVNDLDFSPEGDLLVAACQDGTTRLYRPSDGRFLDVLGEPSLPMLSVDFSANGRWIAAGGEDMLIRVYRVLDGELMLGLREPFVSYELQFSPNVDQLASLTTSGVKIREFGGELQRIDAELEGIVGGVSLQDIVYSPGSEFLALVGNDLIRVIEPFSREDQYILQDQNGALPWAVTFSPDNAFLVVGWSDGSIRFYWAGDGAPMAEFQAHPEGIYRLAFNAEGTLLASLGAEGTLRLWGVEE